MELSFMMLNNIYNEDCIETMAKMSDGLINLIVTDPPYNIQVGGGGIIKKKKYLKNIDNSFGTDFCPQKYLEESKRICRPYNAYWWCSRKLVKDYIAFAEENNFNYDILIWNKVNPIPTKNNKYLPDTEYCIFMRGKDGAYWNNNLLFNNYRKVFNAPVQSNNGHPTPKPISFFINHIKVSSRENDIIYDPFMGSGTTAIACIKTKRNYIGSEINKEYCELINKQIQPYKDQLNIFDNASVV